MTISRRDFLLQSALYGGTLFVTLNVPRPQALAAAAAVAVIAAGSAMLTRGGEPQGLDPAPPNPSQTAPAGQVIPDSRVVTIA